MDQDGSSYEVACLQQDYLRALVAGSGRAADHVVEVALEREVAPQRIYLDIFQPAAYAIGRLWQMNKVSVAGEHLATAILERQMGELHPLFRPARDRRRTLVLGCVPDEWHRVGARMVADFFEADGWTVHYLGASVPVRELVAIARETYADLVGLSAEMLFNVTRVAELVRAFDEAGLGGIPVIAGGMPFIEQPGLARALNLRGSAINAEGALALADEIVEWGPSLAGQSGEARALAALRGAREQIIAAAVFGCAAAGDGEGGLIATGYGYVLRMLEAALVAGEPALLDAQISWANVRQPHDGVTPAQLLGRLQALASAVRACLPGAHGESVAAYVDHLVGQQRRVMGA